MKKSNIKRYINLEKLDKTIKTEINFSLSVVPTNKSGFFISYEDVNMYYCDLTEEEIKFNMVAFSPKDVNNETYAKLMGMRYDLSNAIKSALKEL